MPTYIDGDALKDKMQELHDALARDYEGYDSYVTGFGDAITLLENAPAADVQEVKHAKWVHYGEDIQCSNCGHVTDDICYEGDADSGYYTVLPHYCSNCGARMEDDK